MHVEVRGQLGAASVLLLPSGSHTFISDRQVWQQALHPLSPLAGPLTNFIRNKTL